MLPDHAFSLEAWRGFRVEAGKQDQRGMLAVAQFKVRMPTRIWPRPLHFSKSPADFEHRGKPALEPFQVRAARGVESGDEIFPVVVRSPACVRTVNLVREITIAVEQAAN